MMHVQSIANLCELRSAVARNVRRPLTIKRTDYPAILHQRLDRVALGEQGARHSKRQATLF